MQRKTNVVMSVIVLMSTYNGKDYLSEQLDSLFNQTCLDLSVLVRDDASRDSTVEILKQYKSQHSNMDFYVGTNKGPTNSFIDLLKNAPEANYYAFCDQDDVWCPDKVETAVLKLSGKDPNVPLLYCSSLRVVDEQLNFIKIMHENAHPSKNNALVQSFATGCTMLFNNKAREVFLQNQSTIHVLHDLWMYHVCMFMGEVVFDNNALILYRQHGTNTIGCKTSFWQRVKTRYVSLKTIMNETQTFRSQNAKDFLSCYMNCLSQEDIQLISKLAYYKEGLINRLKLLFSHDIMCDDLSSDFWMRVRIITGRL